MARLYAKAMQNHLQKPVISRYPERLLPRIEQRDCKLTAETRINQSQTGNYSGASQRRSDMQRPNQPPTQLNSFKRRNELHLLMLEYRFLTEPQIVARCAKA